MAKKLKILHEEFMKDFGLSMNRTAMDLVVPVTRIADIVNEKRGITADTALRFARYFNNSAAFWMNLQNTMTWRSRRTRLPRARRPAPGTAFDALNRLSPQG